MTTLEKAFFSNPFNTRYWLNEQAEKERKRAENTKKEIAWMKKVAEAIRKEDKKK
jgi:hypothetical protein